MAGFFVSGSNSRASYRVATQALERAGLSAQRAKLTQSYLRFEALMSTSVTQYNLAVLVNQASTGASGSSFPTENKLNLQDSFIASEIGVFIGKPSSASDATYKLFSYPDPGTFTTSATASYTLYNGFFKLTVDNSNVAPYWDLNRHLKIPTTNYSAPATASTGQVNMITEFDGNTQGFAPVQPCWIFNGKQNIQASINLPTAVSTVETYQRVIVILRGHLAQNVGINMQY